MSIQDIFNLNDYLNGCTDEDTKRNNELKQKRQNREYQWQFRMAIIKITCYDEEERPYFHV